MTMVKYIAHGGLIILSAEGFEALLSGEALDLEEVSLSKEGDLLNIPHEGEA